MVNILLPSAFLEVNFTVMRKLLFIVMLIASMAFTQGEEKVYVCRSIYAETYHKEICEGARNCYTPVVQTTLKEALEMKRRKCKLCYGFDDE